MISRSIRFRIVVIPIRSAPRTATEKQEVKSYSRDVPHLADIVAKVDNRRAIIFPPKDDVTGDRRSLYSQSR
jgi:hypothetical protein